MAFNQKSAIYFPVLHFIGGLFLVKQRLEYMVHGHSVF